MRWLLAIACLSTVALLGAQPPAAGQQNPYRLKEPNQTKACLACHTDFEQKLKLPVVHTAVKSGECSGCHDPQLQLLFEVGVAGQAGFRLVRLLQSVGILLPRSRRLRP